MFRRRNYYLFFGLSSLVYIAGTLLAPLAPNRFNLTPAATHVVQLSIALPIVIIWGAATYGAEKFKNYTLNIKGDPDGRALDKIATGLSILVLSLIVNGLFSIMRGWAMRDGWMEAYTITVNLIAAALPLIAYSFMFVGSVELCSLVKRKISTSQSRVIPVLVFFAIAIAYLSILFTYQYRNSTPNPSKYSSFYLPDILILLTLALPYLVGWWLGIKAALNLRVYQRDVKGIIYKGALHRLIVGSLIVISFAVALQALVGLSAYFAKAGLGGILAIVYLIVLLYSIGFLVIASGTKKLASIEKVR